MKQYNHFDKQEKRYKTSIQVAMIYAIIAALGYVIINFDIVVSYFKTLL
jgi:hypothetical protein